MPTKWEIAKERASADILNAAAAEFAKQGYAGTKIHSIAARAGVANGLVGKYFGSKEELLSTVVEKYRLNKLYEGGEEDPYRVLCVYLDHIRRLQKESSDHFRLNLGIVVGSDYPASVYDTIRKGFEGSLLEAAIRRLQREGALIPGDAFDIFKLLAGSVYVLLNQYSAIGFEPPDNDALLAMIGFRREGHGPADGTRGAAPSDLPDGAPGRMELEKSAWEHRRLIEGLLKEYNLVYRVNLSDASYSLLKIDSGILGEGMEFPDFRDARRFFIEEVAYGPDRPMLRREMDFDVIRTRLKAEQTYMVEYRAVIGGVATWHEMLVSSLGGDEVAIGYAVRDTEVLNRHISKALMDSYEGIYVINLNTDQLKILKGTGILQERSGVVSNSWLLRSIADTLEGEARDYYLALSDPEYEKQALAKDGKLEYYYQSRSYGAEPKWLKIEIHVLTWLDGMPETAVVGITGVDTLQREKNELTDRLAKALKEVTEERNRFTVAADLINSANWSFLLDGNDEITDAEFFGEPAKVLGIDLKIAPHAWEEILHPDDREKALEAFNAAVRDHEGKTPYDVVYRMRDRNGNYNWFRSAGRIIAHDDGTREFFGIHINITDRIEEELKHQRELEAALAEARQANRSATEQSIITSYFLEPYSSAYYVGLDSLSCHVYRCEEELKREFPITTNYLDTLNGYIDRHVVPEDREGLRERIDPEYMRGVLSEREGYTHTFHALWKGEERTYLLNVIRGADGSHAAFGFRDITEELREQNERLREAEDSRKLIESVASVYRFAFAVDMDTSAFRVIRMEDSVKKRLKVEEVRSYSEAVTPLFGMLHPSDVARMRRELDFATIRKRLEDRCSYNVEYRVITGGATDWHEMNVTHISRGEIAMGFGEKDLEITMRHLEEKRFSEYFALYEGDVDSGTLKVIKSSPFYGKGRKGTALPYSDAMRAFAETQEGDARDFFLRIADLDFVKRDLAEEGRHTYTYRSANIEDRRWVDCTSYVTLRNEDGTPAMFTLGFSYVDSLGAARQELQSEIAVQKTRLEEQQKQLEGALSMAQAANRAKSEFLFNMSHDIRTPMNAILGFTNIAEKHINDRDKIAECLDKTRQSGNLLLTLINSVLDMSRIESGSAEPDEKEGDILLSFVSIESTLHEEAAKKDIRLTFEFGEIADRFVYVDYTRCLRVFTNLISNAIKYTKEGGRVRVRCEQVSPERDGTASYRYTVEDNGIGMSEEFQKHMFEAFTRERSSTASGIQGTGLGLSVCKTFVDYLGGTISCESRPGEGTRFTVILPFRVQKEQNYHDPVTGEMRSSGAEPVSSGRMDFMGRRALLVEDNEMNREIAVEILEEEGLAVDEAEDGSVALDFLKEKGPDHYDFILMDIQMPVMNGYEATREIRRLYPDRRIPIVALSANAFEEDRRASREAGMDDHVAKPINVRELMAVLARYL